MDALQALLASYGLTVVFLWVLADQGGLPLPSYPMIVVAAALATDAGQPLWPIVLAAVLAALLADGAWYFGGRRFGARLLRLMCRVSLSPESCVLTTRGVYARYGAPALVIAKFVPGLAAVGTTLAGDSGTRLPRFLLFDALGALLWAGLAVALGALFHEAVREVLLRIEELGRWGVVVLAATVAGFLAVKWIRRRWFLRQLRMARISSEELNRLLAADPPPVVLDVRPAAARAASGWIPGAVFAATVEDARTHVAEEVVVYCDCPDEASAALLAQALRRAGFRRVRPLNGGFAGWAAAGYRVAREAAGPLTPER
ncbi:VTT domain-containing protein [Coralloluteibacterium stylophorae]|uniref:VTT domain-containing protein n=1 Tax=Coralloluteibacterium stylophorae TaxID=1776034 RepID=A0A8J8AW33_9GAMM|nr:rhodanese-like domain-containing protein [Coralloluteibacterium stylophorae]MBS7458119.1 VTT domain-containing protein [Coralloluteibacterium stylophorae]